MSIHTELYCPALHDVSRVDMIRAIHEAWSQLIAARDEPEGAWDHTSALDALESCLGAAGHSGFTAPEDTRTAEDKARDVRTDKGVENITVRFFGMQSQPNGDLEIVEITESEFTDAGGTIEYERDSIFANGVRQICLTTDEVVSDWMDAAELFLSDARGIYIPKDFAESVDRDKVTGVDAETWADLEAGPDRESYWDAWTETLDSAVLTKDDGTRWTLYQDGDLWILPETV